jgi:hypothetical protein
MSVEFEALVIYGVPANEVDFSNLSQEKIYVVEDALGITIDNWNGYDKDFYGLIVEHIEEGFSKPLANFFAEEEAWKEKFFEIFKHYDIYITGCPQFYLIGEVY